MSWPKPRPTNPVAPPSPVGPSPLAPPPPPRPDPVLEPTGVVLGSFGNRTIDQHDALFLAASDAVERKKGVRVDPRFLKAVMDVESGGDGDYPPDRCRAADGQDRVPACGPMQIKWAYHRQRCPECDGGTVAGQIEMAAHIIGDTMLAKRTDEYGALFAVYFLADDVNGTTRRAYRARIERLIAAMAEDAGDRPDPWRPYPMPKHRRLIVQKPYEGAGFDRVAFRGPQINAFATHITAGGDPGPVEFWQRFFGAGGERARDALVDSVIDRDGTIAILNDPFSQTEGGTRAGWANGGVDGLEGEGVAYFRASPNINATIFSCEHVAAAGQAWTDALIESSIELRVWLMQKLKIPAASYPTNPRTGATCEAEHYMFALKSCPDFPYRDKLRPVVRAEVKKRLAAWQGGDVDPPPAEPAKTYTDLGITLEQVAYYFGTMTRVNADGTVDRLPFDPQGPLSLLWLKRCEREMKFPESEELRVFPATIGKGDTWFATWEGGWTALKPVGDTRASWIWADEVVS